MAYGFHDVPVEPSAYGEAMYHRGRALVERHGLRMETLVWDADEVLWDWAMSGPLLFARMPLAVVGNLGHREWIAVRAGILELLWGMRHASLSLGLDPHVRIWTSGYPWRLWRILREIRGFEELLGPPGYGVEGGAEVLRRHPRVFTRPDYVDIVHRLLDRREREPLLEALAEPARSTIRRQLETRPHDSGFKIPELAMLAGREGFGAARFLVDDARRNVEWFLAAGRSAVHVKSVTPRLFGVIPNSAWSPRRFLERSASRVVEAVSEALAGLASADAPRIAEAVMSLAGVGERHDDPPPPRVMEIDIPSEVLWREWINPMRELKRAFKKARATP